MIISPNYTKLEEISIVRETLFLIKLSKIIHKFEVIVNIDKSAFNRSIIKTTPGFKKDILLKFEIAALQKLWPYFCNHN